MGGDVGLMLEAVQDVALAAAAADADAIRRAARERAARIVAEARVEAAGVIAAHRAAAERMADVEERARLAEARAQAGAIVLRAQRSVLSEASAAARAAVRQLTGDPRCEALRKRLAAEARIRLAGSVPVHVKATADGGLIARAGSRQLNYSLDALLDRCLATMASDLEQLWR